MSGVLDDALIDLIGHRLRAAVPAGSKVVLFGSFARDDGHSGSDIDLLVIEPNCRRSDARVCKAEAGAERPRQPIDILVIDELQAARRSTVRGTVIERALREGRVLAET